MMHTTLLRSVEFRREIGGHPDLYAAMCARKSRVQLASKRLISAWLGLGVGVGFGLGLGLDAADLGLVRVRG